MSERLFFALWPGPAQRPALASLARTIGRDAGRPTHPQDLHLTLVFLGSVDAATRRCAERTADGVRVSPFALRLDRIGYWPGPRVLWCGPEAIADGLRSLVGQLTRGLERCGLEPEKRPYNPHVTLMRKAPEPLPGEVPAGVAEPLDWPVQEFALACGSGAQAPRYRVLRRWPLRV